MIYLLLISMMGFSTDEVLTIYSPEELNQQTNTLTLISETPTQCYAETKVSDCARILVYEKDSEIVHHMLVDKRSAESEKFDVNDVIREPSSYSGPSEVIQLKEVFNTSFEILSVKASFKNALELELVLGVVDNLGNTMDMKRTVETKKLYKLPKSN